MAGEENLNIREGCFSSVPMFLIPRGAVTGIYSRWSTKHMACSSNKVLFICVSLLPYPAYISTAKNVFVRGQGHLAPRDLA